MLPVGQTKEKVVMDTEMATFATSIKADMPTEEPEQKIRGFVGYSSAGTFQDPLWKLYKRIKGISWDRAGKFDSRPLVEINGGGRYVFRHDPRCPFRFTRWNGEVIEPRSMETDMGSVPRVVWSVPGLDPNWFAPAYLIHDWEFVQHHCDANFTKSFEEVNTTFAEAIFTMMMADIDMENWRTASLVYAAVSSFIGRRVWDRQWDVTECHRTLLKGELSR